MNSYKYLCIVVLYHPYPEIDDANFEGTLWLPLNMRVRYGISIAFLLTSSYKVFLGYA